MCTLALAWRVFENAPVVVGANRDESIDRPAEPPGVYAENPLTIAPRDAEAGGTWIGYNEYGVFAGITNRWGDADLAGERSRGLLVAEALARESAADAAAYVAETTSAYEYEGFFLVVADAADAICLEWDGELRRTAFDPGVHVVVNVGFDGTFEIPDRRSDAGERQAENARAVREALSIESAFGNGGRPPDPDAWLDRAGAVLGDHEYGVCVHGDGFGTRSSSLIALGNPTSYRFADGPPCRNPYRPIDLAADEAIDFEGQV